MLPFLILPILLSFIYLIYQYLIYPLLLSPLSKIPSAHWSSPISTLWLNHIRKDGKSGTKYILAAHHKHGSIVRLSPNELSVHSLDGLRKVYLGGFEKTSWYADEFMNYSTPNLVSLMGNKEHSFQKRMMSHVYSKSSILSNAQLSSVSTELVYGKLGEVLRDAAEKGCDFDAYGLNQAMGADFTSAFLLGRGCCTGFIGDLAAGETFRRRYKLKMKGLSGHEEATRQLESQVLELCRLAEKTDMDAEKGVVHSQLSSQLERAGYVIEKGAGGDNFIVASEIFDHLIAGVETTRITLTYLQWELSRSPALQSSLRAELRTLSPPINLSDPTTSFQIPSTRHLPDPKAIDSLPLLNAILKETLRRYPPSPAHLDRVTPPEGAVIDGFMIPAGTVVGTSSVGMHQNASVFPNPEEFRPERWLVHDEEKLREMNRWFWAFGSGGRMCIGSHFAIYLLKLIVAAIYTDFETSIVDDEGIEQEDAFLAGPVGDKLVLKFKVAVPAS